ncbi:hypothetical protein [Streptomyces wuyuanensis]|uniref:hypothetical protein n=1 Tax=Streptomyces wuyuanensis TaxID=1196353 RepID=UPI00371357A7
MPDTALLINVRLAHLVEDKDLVKFAATARAAVAAGWHYMVAFGLAPPGADRP